MIYVYLRSILVDDLTILINLLFPREHTIEQLNSVILFIDIKLPYEELFRSRLYQIRDKMENTYALIVLPTSRTS